MKLAARVVMRVMSSPDHRWLPSTRMSVASVDHRRRQALPGLLGEARGGQVRERVLAHDLEHPVPGARRGRLGDHE